MVWAVRSSKGRRHVAALTAMLMVPLAGCSEPTGSAPAPLPTGPQPQSSSQAPSRPAVGATSAPGLPGVDRTDPVEVYRAWWHAVEEAFGRGEPGYPELGTYGADPILARERNQIRVLREQGIVQRTRLSLMPRVLLHSDIIAEIADCLRGPAGTYRDAVTGRPRTPRGYRNDVATRDALLVSLQKRGGYWFVVAATNEGVQPC